MAAEAARKSLWHFKRLLTYGTGEEVDAFFAELRHVLTPDRRARIEVEVARMFGERKRRDEIHEQAMTMRPRGDR
jgi:O-methyltransferase involved in polyketide biosynthesis